MAKTMLAPGSIMHLSGAEGYARNVIKFIFTCRAYSDGTQKAIYASVKIATNGDVNVCDFEVIRDQIPGMEQGTAMLFSDSESVDESTVEGYCLANFDSHIQ
jgi:hypothetical protein